MDEVRYVQDYAMYILLGLVVVEERMLKWSQLHWLKV